MTIADCDRRAGQILPLFALMLALLLLPVTALAVDGGLLLQTHANLEATAQSAAESGSQAVDVTALDRSGQFELCTGPDGGSTCGNGVGDVAQVVAQSAYPGSGGSCAMVALAQLGPARGEAAGCELALRSLCQRAGGGAAGATGVTVLLWRTVAMPLLSLGPWASIVVRAEATAWLAQGYSRQISGAASLPGQC